MTSQEILDALTASVKAGGEVFVSSWGNAVHFVASEFAHKGDISGAQKVKSALQGLPLQKEAERALAILTGLVEPATRKRGKVQVPCYRLLANWQKGSFDVARAQQYLADFRQAYKRQRAAGANITRGALLLNMVRDLLPPTRERHVNAATIADSLARLRLMVPDCPQAQQASIGRILSEAIENLERL